MGARPEQQKFVANSQIVVSSSPVTTTAQSPTQISNPFPIGDLVYNSLEFSITGNLNMITGGGTVVTDGGLVFLQAIYLSTPQHNMIWEGIDGIMAHDMERYEERNAPTHSDVSATTVSTTPTFRYGLRIPFKDPQQFNFNDTGLDVLRSGQPLLQINTGVFTNFVSGGAAADTVQTYTIESHLRMDPGPIEPAKGDAPTRFMPYRGVLKVPISSTVAQYQIFLAFGDRIIRRLYVTQRNGSTLARLNNTIIGAAETDRISLKINSNFPWVDRLEWTALQQQNQRDYGLAAASNGVGCIDFFRRVLGNPDGQAGAKLSDALSVLSKNQGTLELDVDVTTVSNGQLWIGYDAVKFIPQGALRPSPNPAT